MLYDIVPIPLRYREGSEIDNIIPIFSNEEELDEVEWVGWHLDVDAIIRCGCYKYKTVEISGYDTIERTFVTQQPIDLNGRWWESDEPIFPIMQKTFRSNDLNTIQTIKYLDGITGILQLTGVQVCNTKSMHTEILQAVQSSIYQDPRLERILRDQEHPIHKIIIGDDETNLDTYLQAITMKNDPQSMRTIEYVCNWLPEIRLDPWLKRFLINGASLKEINLSRSIDFGTPMCSTISATIVPPFDPSDDDVIYQEENPDRKWAFLQMVVLLQTIAATDYSIHIKLTNNKITECKKEFYNRYKGFGYPCISQDQDYYASMLFEALARWHWSHLLTHTRVDHPVAEILIQRNWLDEAYIQIKYEDGEESRYYIDFTMFQIASISVMS